MGLSTHVWRKLLQLLLINNVVTSVRCGKITTSVRDMDPTQLIGTFQNINPKTDGVVQCPDAIRVSRVETIQSASGVLYILPHRFISLPQVGGGSTDCQGTPIDSSITSESAAVLRRDTQTTLDRNDSLINEFALAQERFFIGVELGSRKCDLLETPDGTVSMWMAPSREISVPFPGTSVSVVYQPGSKYVYYYTSTPCVFKGDARERGVVTPAPSMSNSRTPTPSRSPLPEPSPGGASPSDVATVSITPSVGTSSDGTSVVSPYIPGPAPAISVSTVPGLSDSSDRVCFPADAMVGVFSDRGHSRCGSECMTQISMHRLQTGHIVNSGVFGQQDTVVGFTHYVSHVWTRMVRLTAADNRTLVVSGGHFVYVHSCSKGCCCGGDSIGDGVGRQWECRRADAVRVGDRLIDATRGVPITVVKSESVNAKGLYNPQTFSGDIVVNGFVVTTFTTAVKNAHTGHALMTPWRLLERLRLKIAWRSK